MGDEAHKRSRASSSRIASRAQHSARQARTAPAIQTVAAATAVAGSVEPTFVLDDNPDHGIDWEL